MLRLHFQVAVQVASKQGPTRGGLFGGKLLLLTPAQR